VLPEADAFATPLGEVAIDQDAIRRLARMSQVVVYDAEEARRLASYYLCSLLQCYADALGLR
jgi:hypothetical protein